MGSGWRDSEDLREVAEVDSQSLVVSWMWEHWVDQRGASGVMPGYVSSSRDIRAVS